MEKLKAKFQLLKTEMEEYEQLEIEYKSKMVQALSLKDKAQSEYQSVQRKLFLVNQMLEEAEARLCEYTTKLEKISGDSCQYETERGELETQEKDNDEKLNNVDHELKETKQIYETSELGFRDLSRKVVMLESDIKRNQEKIESSNALNETLQKNVEELQTSFKNLEEEETTVSGEEATLEERVRELDTKINESLVTLESVTRQLLVLERQKTDITEEITNYKQRSLEIQQELDKIASFADDPLLASIVDYSSQQNIVSN